jgi:hypothetical protein
MILANGGSLRAFTQHPGQFAVHDADDNPVQPTLNVPRPFSMP